MIISSIIFTLIGITGIIIWVGWWKPRITLFFPGIPAGTIFIWVGVLIVNGSFWLYTNIYHTVLIGLITVLLFIPLTLYSLWLILKHEPPKIFTPKWVKIEQQKLEPVYTKYAAEHNPPNPEKNS